MIAVSDSFKNAIKSSNRDIYAYVDVVYDKNVGSYSVTKIPTTSPISKSDNSDLIDDIKVMKNYATLENNYTLLDGSSLLVNKNTLGDVGGYVSEDIFENIQDTEIILLNNEDGAITTGGFSIFFKNNLPFDFVITITDINDNIITINVNNNMHYNYQYIFDEKITIKSMSLIVSSVEYKDRRLRISDIDFSLSDLYQGDELINFNVTEEIDLLLESTPINTCSISLNNYPDERGTIKFDPINPTGIVSYLTENTIIIPYIGVLTEDVGIEYVKMGTFYLKDWFSNNDGNVTLNGQSLMARLQNIDIESDGTFLTKQFTGSSLAQYFTKMTGYDFNFVSGVYNNIYLQDYNLLNWLKGKMPFQVMWEDDNGIYHKRKFHITRDNVVSEDNINEDISDYITKNMLINDVKYETKSVINKVKINDITSYSRSSSTKENAVEDTHILESQTEYIWYKSSKYINYNSANFSYTTTGSGVAELIDANYYLIYVKFTGKIGDSFTITYNGFVYEDAPTKEWIFKNDLKSGDELSLDFSKYLDANDTSLPSTAKFYLTMDAKYKVIAETLGDPSLESGDTVAIQTRYGDSNESYKNVVITKQNFKYDGGLTCSLEGMGN